MFSAQAIADMQAHAIAEFPRESVGLVVDGRYLPQVNIHPEPNEHFLLATSVWAQHGSSIQAVVHSHPDGRGCPSCADMQGQLNTDVPWAIIVTNGEQARQPIVWGDGTPVPPLLRRPFVHGVTDCYGLARDWFRQQGIILPDVPREDEWWFDNGPNLFLEGFAAAGFTWLPLEETQPGDGILMQLDQQRSNGPDHCGVLLSGDMILHHLPNRFSRTESFPRWRKMVVCAMRYAG